MARIRNPTSTGTVSSSRKRAAESQSPAPLPKRRQQQNLDVDVDLTPFSRESSPTKNVHWGRRIISGPTIIDPQTRSHSPSRPALRSPARQVDNEHDSCEEESEEDYEVTHGRGPAAQLEEDSDGEQPGSAPAKNAAQPKIRSPDMRASPINDDLVCQRLEQLKARIREFALAFPNRPKRAKEDVLSALLQPEHEQLVRYIGCVAMGGRNGEQGWQDLLTDDSSRKIVVWGVLGKALKENVFDSLYFGAYPALENALKKHEAKLARHDGFYRQRSRSSEILAYEKPQSPEQRNEYYDQADIRLLVGLETLLMPLWTLGGKDVNAWISSSMRSNLFNIVGDAGRLARMMRKARDVIYYWPPTFKDEEFEPARMDCVNLNDMIRASPYDRVERQGRERPVLRDGEAQKSQAIVRVVCFPGVQSFRQGGGELAKKLLAQEARGIDADGAPPDVVAARRRGRPTDRHGNELTGNEGLRTRVVGKGVVMLQWGQQRLLTKEAGTSVHIDAVREGKMDKYIQDAAGHVDLMMLFRERTASPNVGLGSPQRSPSLVERGWNLIRGSVMGNAEEGDEDEDEDDEDEERVQQRQSERQRGRVAGPASPRSKKAR